MRSAGFIAALALVLVSCQREESTITGRLVGFDGKPTLLAHVYLADATTSFGWTSIFGSSILSSEVVQKDGTFRISTRQKGPFVLFCTAVGYKHLRIPLPLEAHAEISIDVQLECAVPDTAQSEIPIIASVDGGATWQRAYLQKQASGVFGVELAAIGDSVAYTVSLGDPASMATTLLGASADRYEWTSMNQYASVVAVRDGRARIEYRVPPQTVVALGSYRFHDVSSIPAEFARRQQSFAEYATGSDSSLQRHLRSGKSFGTFMYPWIAFADTLARFAVEANSKLMRDELAVEVLECYQRANVPVGDAELLKLIAGISPTSLAWVYHGTLALATQRFPEMGDSYFTSLVDRHPWRPYVAYLLFYKCASAKQVHDDSTVMDVLTQLAKDFKNTVAAREAQEFLAPRGTMQIGAPLPAFAFSSLDDSTQVFTNETFHGHNLLLVFWSTSCSHCVAEMPVLHRIYEKYEKVGLKILSVSLGSELKQVIRFRKFRWPMPWCVTVLSNEETPSVEQRFAAQTPMHILVDPTGNIVMVDSLLYGNRLDSTLAQVLGEKNH
ncbi:MAG: TlpA disulfide reductase family protein [Bacteroidota bacterium]